MTKIKMCGLRRTEDIRAVNRLKPDYVGFVFAKKSRRYVTPEQAESLRKALAPSILAVGVFVNADVREVSDLLNRGIIDIAQLHGQEDEAYIESLRSLTDKPLIQAFQLKPEEAGNHEAVQATLERAAKSSADFVLIDSGAGSGETFDWRLLSDFPRDYFLAGGLCAENVTTAIEATSAFAVDISSNLETDGYKDPKKMEAFVAAVRGAQAEKKKGESI